MDVSEAAIESLDKDIVSYTSLSDIRISDAQTRNLKVVGKAHVEGQVRADPGPQAADQSQAAAQAAATFDNLRAVANNKEKFGPTAALDGTLPLLARPTPPSRPSKTKPFIII